MSYISHEDYKNLMAKFQVSTPKGMLKEDIEEKKELSGKQKQIAKAAPPPDEITGADFKALKAKKGMKEYSYTDNYPGSWGYRESIEENVYGGDPIPAENIERISDRTYKIIRPDGEEVKVYFDRSETEEELDAYTSSGWIEGTDQDGNEYTMAVQFSLGEVEPDYDSLEFFPSRDFKPHDVAGFDNEEKPVSESHAGNEEWYDSFIAAIDKMVVDPKKHAIVMKGLDHIDPVSVYGDVTPDEAAFQFIKDAVRAYTRGEGLKPDPLQATGQTIDVTEGSEEYADRPFKVPMRRDTSKLDYDPDASRFEPDYMKTPGEDDDDDDDFELGLDDDDFMIGSSDDITKRFKKAVARDKGRYPFLQEDVAPYGFETLPPDTKQQLQTSGLKELTPDERKQLEEYIESVKTIKKEIAKLAGKAGKKVKEEGGNRTGLVMPVGNVTEADFPDDLQKIEDRIPEKVYNASVKVIKHLLKAGLNHREVMMFLRHEAEEAAEQAKLAQWDTPEPGK